MKSDRWWAVTKDPLKYRWLMFWVIGAIYFLACLHRISPTVIALDLVLEFGAGATALGLMSSSYFYLYAAVQPPVGVLSDTLGPRRVITIFTLIACIGTVIFGSAYNMTMATVGRALIGLGVGGIFVPGMKIL
ncbi:MAG: MFS transporter, partial [Deltaproteobacteria bacterium]|nr:MFS transporter [Deltaproteobacteria bacterium]